MTKNFCLLHSISHKQYIIWLSLMMHMCKMVNLQASFSFFQNFDFSVVRNHTSYGCHLWHTRAFSSCFIHAMVVHMRQPFFKKTFVHFHPNFQIFCQFLPFFCPRMPLLSRIGPLHICKMIIYSEVFFIFSKFWFSGSIGGRRAKHGPKWQKLHWFSCENCMFLLSLHKGQQMSKELKKET